MQNPLDRLKTSWGRLSAGIALILSVAWLNGGQITGIVEWRATTAFVAAFLAWLYGCLPEKQAPSTHDKQLFERFRASIDEPTLEFLRQQDFGAVFHLHRVEGMRQIAGTWNGSSFEFDDRVIQKAFSPILDQLKTFNRELAIKTQQISDDAARIPWDYKNEENCRAQAKELNAAANSLSTKLDKFIPVARRRLE